MVARICVLCQECYQRTWKKENAGRCKITCSSWCQHPFETEEQGLCFFWPNSDLLETILAIRSKTQITTRKTKYNIHHINSYYQQELFISYMFIYSVSPNYLSNKQGILNTTLPRPAFHQLDAKKQNAKEWMVIFVKSQNYHGFVLFWFPQSGNFNDSLVLSQQFHLMVDHDRSQFQTSMESPMPCWTKKPRINWTTLLMIRVFS